MIANSINVYVAERGYAFEYGENRLQIITDKEEYSPGENLKAIIFSPVETGYLFYTVETNKIEDVNIVKIEKKYGNS
ncbi:MAG: hypothetical protein ABDH49_02335 [Candidatus Hydrothermales bacterium]